MPQCSKKIGNRRCKASCLKGKKYCLFHSKKAVSFRGTRKGKTTKRSKPANSNRYYKLRR